MQNFQTNNVDIKRYWEILIRRRYTALAAALAVVSVFTWGGFLWPETYEASSTFIVETSFVNPLVSGVSPTLEERIRNLKSSFASRDTIERAVKKTGIAENAGQSAAFIDDVKKNIRIISKSSEGENNIFTISYAGKDPRFVSGLVNTLISEYGEESLNHRKAEAAGAYNFIQNQVSEYKAKLEASDNSIRVFREKNRHFIPQNEAMFSQKEDSFNSAETVADIKLKELELKRDSLRKQLSGDKEIGNSYAAKEGSPQARLSFLNNQLALLNAKFTDRHPEVIKVKDEIEELKREISQARKLQKTGTSSAGMNPVYEQMKEELAATNSEIESLMDRSAELRRRQEQARGVSGLMPGLQEEWSKLQRDRNEYQKTYDDLLQKLEKARVANDLELSNQASGIRVTDPAKFPRYPVRPDRIKLIILGMVVGIVSGIGSAVMIENWNKSYKDEETLESDLKLTVLAAVPQIRISEDEIAERQRDKTVFTCAGIYVFIIGLVLIEELVSKFTGFKILHLLERL